MDTAVEFVADNSTRPKIDINWDDGIQDLIPFGDYDFTTDLLFKNTVSNTTPCAADASNWKVKDVAADTNMCTKFWYIGYSGIACVEVTGHITRPFEKQPLVAPSTDPIDLCDFSLDYVSY